MRKVSTFLSLLLILTLCLPAAATADEYHYPILTESTYAPLEMTVEERAAANLFLSNFTEVGIDSIGAWYDEKAYVDFAHDHIWFNDQDSYEYGEYFAGNNCRVSDDSIQRIIDKYFYDAPQVDLSQTRFDYRDGYYYHCETGGWINCGFAHTISLCPIGDNIYFASFMIFGGGNYWENSVLDDSLAEIEAAHGHPGGYGCALVYAEDLSDRSTYKLVSYSSLR